MSARGAMRCYVHLLFVRSLLCFVMKNKYAQRKRIPSLNSFFACFGLEIDQSVVEKTKERTGV